MNGQKYRKRGREWHIQKAIRIDHLLVYDAKLMLLTLLDLG